MLGKKLLSKPRKRKTGNSGSKEFNCREIQGELQEQQKEVPGGQLDIRLWHRGLKAGCHQEVRNKRIGTGGIGCECPAERYRGYFKTRGILNRVKER